MTARLRLLLIVGLLLFASAPSRANAEVFRVGYPSLATGFAASWVTADKGIWKKHGLDVELIFLRGGSRTGGALIGGRDAGKDVTFLSVGDGGPTARVAALSAGVIHASMFTPPSDLISEKAGMRILSRVRGAHGAPPQDRHG